jgi:tellurite resistance protein TehA-like permease
MTLAIGGMLIGSAAFFFVLAAFSWLNERKSHPAAPGSTRFQ